MQWYDLIKSPVIREYFASGKSEPVREDKKKNVILSAHGISIPDKVAMLRQLDSSKDDTLIDTILGLEGAYDAIVNGDNWLFEMYEDTEAKITNYSDIALYHYNIDTFHYGYFISFDEIPGEYTEPDIFYCTLIDRNTYEEIGTLTLEWINGKVCLTHISYYYVNDVFEKLDMLINSCDTDGISSNRHDLPFKTGDKVKIVIPVLSQPFRGKIFSEKDGNGCWYHWLYVNDYEKDDRMIDLSYTRLFVSGTYNTLDCLYPDD